MTATAKHASQASEALTRALLDAASRGVRPRCGDYETSHWFLSDHEGERAQAALLCAGCCVLSECDAVGQHQRFGVFGGRNTTRHANGKRPSDG